MTRAAAIWTAKVVAAVVVLPVVILHWLGAWQ